MDIGITFAASILSKLREKYLFCGCRRNEKCQTNDKFIGDYRSIYKVK